MVYIENATKNKYLGFEENVVKFVEENKGNKWEKGDSTKDGYFTLTHPSSQKLLTAASTEHLETKGKWVIS